MVKKCPCKRIAGAEETVPVKKEYDGLKTIGKVLREFAIWVIPQFIAFMIEQNPDLNTITVAAMLSAAVKAVVDFLKHK